MDAQIIHARIEGLLYPLFLVVFPIHPHAMDNFPSLKPVSWLDKELLGGPDTWCNAGGNAASDGDPLCTRGSYLEAQMARQQWALLVASQGGEVVQDLMDCGWDWDNNL